MIQNNYLTLINLSITLPMNLEILCINIMNKCSVLNVGSLV